MINAITLCIACWFWSDEPPKPEPPFRNALLSKHEMIYNRIIRTCCLYNGKTKPFYFFTFEGFAPHTMVKVSPLDCFKFTPELLEIDCKGNGIIMAFIVPGKTVPDVLDMQFYIGNEEVRCTAMTRDQE